MPPRRAKQANNSQEVPVSTQPTAADAEVILKLYDLRREPEMRKARNWWLMTFWPQSVEDFLKYANAMGSQENNWLRQVTGYWEMAASMVVHGAVHPDLFLEPSFCGEMFFIFAKTRPFLSELREKLGSPSMMSNVEKVINLNQTSRERLKQFEARVAARVKAIAETAKAS
jgi:hypothetical protein